MSHPDVDAWDAWHPRQVAERLRDLPVPWYVAAGWSVDLFRGEQTRAHEDRLSEGQRRTCERGPGQRITARA